MTKVQTFSHYQMKKYCRRQNFIGLPNKLETLSVNFSKLYQKTPQTRKKRMKVSFEFFAANQQKIIKKNVVKPNSRFKTDQQTVGGVETDRYLTRFSLFLRYSLVNNSRRSRTFRRTNEKKPRNEKRGRKALNGIYLLCISNNDGHRWAYGK